MVTNSAESALGSATFVVLSMPTAGAAQHDHINHEGYVGTELDRARTVSVTA